MKILLSSSAKSLRTALNTYASTATVEAEYGDEVVEGTAATLAHHGSRAENPCPCLCTPAEAGKIDVFGISHVDLDTIGGILGLLGKRPGPMSFWTLAASVDLHGPHKLNESGASPEDLARLYAWWSWSETHRCNAPRDGSVADVTDCVADATETLVSILDDDPEMLARGAEWHAKKEELNKNSFFECRSDVIVRIHKEFVNGLYTDPNGCPARAVVGYNPEKGSVTISLADPTPGVSCAEIARVLWGPLAGGHPGIAGSPRGEEMCVSELARARDAMVAVLWGARHD